MLQLEYSNHRIKVNNIGVSTVHYVVYIPIRMENQNQWSNDLHMEIDSTTIVI